MKITEFKFEAKQLRDEDLNLSKTEYASMGYFWQSKCSDFERQIQKLQKQNEILMKACEKAIKIDDVLQQTIILKQAMTEAKRVME